MTNNTFIFLYFIFPFKQGYDFNFMRRSRLFEECSAATQHKWTTQYIGGNRLAICSSKFCTFVRFEIFKWRNLWEVKLFNVNSEQRHAWWTEKGVFQPFSEESNIAVSGVPSAYFPKDHDCHKIKSDEQLLGDITNIFQSELKMAGITQSFKSFSLLCG